MFRLVRTASLVWAFIICLQASDPDRDFSGKWILDARTTLSCVQQESVLKCSSTQAEGAPVEWSYDLNGASTRYRFGDEDRNSKVKWEGSALLINTIVSGPRDYSMLDRWTLSSDHLTLTISRQTVQNGSESESTLVYRREGAHTAVAPPTITPPPAAYTNNPNPVARPPVLQPPPAPTSSSEIVVTAGTRIPLSLRNAIDTKHSREGDRVYLDTIYPVTVNNRVVIPRGSYVSGTLTTSKPAGAIGKKGELFIRFDSLILPNGVTRDFRSRAGSVDTQGSLDRKEGKITGEGTKGQDTATVAETAAGGTALGATAGLHGGNLGLEPLH